MGEWSGKEEGVGVWGVWGGGGGVRGGGGGRGGSQMTVPCGMPVMRA